MEANRLKSTTSTSSLCWKILRRPMSNSDNQSELGIKRISRKATHGFNLIPCHLMKDGSRDATLCYTLPIPNAPTLILQGEAIDATLGSG
ncbi:calmodulin-lysine N-methyltransferase-like [Nicotiana tomentosiformis]|uniref:calmodulin-lysine N-methyltransferase-like n=1 Tax=Nicotiana tomentosiformis TaxID=4098 RepID=UPI00388CEA9E